MDLQGCGITEGREFASRYRVGEPSSARVAQVLRLADRAPGLLTLIALDPPLEAALGKPWTPGEHPGVLWAWDRGVLSPGVGWVITPEISGPTLDDLLDAGPLTAARAIALMRSVIDALGAVHAQGGPLLNLRPSVIYALPGWNEERVRIPCAPWLIGPAAGQRLGGYCAPELAWDPPSPQADQFSLGVILYELLQGTPPHNPEAPPGDRTQIAVDLDGVPAQLNALVRRLLADEPADRLPDLRALDAELAALQPGLPGDDIPTYGSYTPVIPARHTGPMVLPPPPELPDAPGVAPPTDSVVGVLMVLLSAFATALGLSYALLYLW